MRHSKSPIPRAVLAFLVLAGGSRLLACSSSATCTPGVRVICPCGGGINGVKTCQSDDTFAACDCQATGTTSSTGGGTSVGSTSSSSGASVAASSTGASGSSTRGTTGGSTASGGGTTGGTSGGTTGGSSTGASNGLCSAPIDTPGDCGWPEFCLSGHCVPPQNLDPDGSDDPSLACGTSSSTVQGAGNLDAERADGVDLVVPNSPIIADLQQVPIQSDQDCVTYIGTGATEYQESARACAGGTSDTGGATICASTEAALLFRGDAFDPQNNFAAAEGAALDAQFYWMTSAETPVSFTGTTFGAAQSGFIIPGAGWTSSGGPFVLVQCLGEQQYPLIVNSYPVTLHFAATDGDAGVSPGNSFCAEWSP